MTRFDLDIDWVRLVRTASRTAAGGLAVAGASAVVLWDVDFYAVRDKWEHFKIAMFGEWTPTDRRSAAGEPAGPPVVPSVLEAARDITFFTEVKAKEHGLEVTTGVSFSTVADLLAARQKERWCYVMITPRGGLARQIGLGKQSGSAAPFYTNPSAYPPEELAVVGISARTLEKLAKSHCRFAKATAPPAGSTRGGRA